MLSLMFYFLFFYLFYFCFYFAGQILVQGRIFAPVAKSHPCGFLAYRGGPFIFSWPFIFLKPLKRGLPLILFQQSPTAHPLHDSPADARRQLAPTAPLLCRHLQSPATRLSFPPWFSPVEGIDSGLGVRPVTLTEMARALPGLAQATLRLRVPRHLLLCLLLQL